MEYKHQTIYTFLVDLIQDNCSSPAFDWFMGAVEKVQQHQERSLYMAFSAVPRYSGKEQVNFTPPQEQQAVTNWGLQLHRFTIDQLMRIALVLSTPEMDETTFLQRLNTLLDTADMGEQVALYKGFPLFPFPNALTTIAAEAIRTNIADVFDAIALDNSYPASHLSDAAWNQMVLKTAFMQRPIIRIQGLRGRANPELDRIISDYAHERWAAGRNITPEIWMAITSPMESDGTLKADIGHLIEGSNFDRQAAALLLLEKEQLEVNGKLEAEIRQIQDGELSWESLAKSWWSTQP